MPALRTRWLLLLCLLPTAGLRADDAGPAIPTVGRPADLPFSGASGDFRVWADAEPKTLEAQKPLTLTLHVEARTEFRRPPRRIDLRELPSFKDRFTFEEIDDAGERQPGPRRWDFVYRLHPKGEGVTVVPGVPFVFYNPDIQYPRKGFQTAYTDPIPLTVTPPAVYVVPVSGPEVVFSGAAGPSVTATWGQWAPPGPWAVGALLSAPPLLCAAWYLCWRRLYPDAARLASRRRSLAARRALQALRGAERLPPVRAARAAAVTADYLRSRFDAPAEEPTPAEAAACLRRAGCSSALAEQAAGFFRACDAARFAPLTPTPLPPGERGRGEGVDTAPDLPADAVRFILAVEAETWSAPHS